jgi:uncharacterized protein (DUF2235 family)
MGIELRDVFVMLKPRSEWTSARTKGLVEKMSAAGTGGRSRERAGPSGNEPWMAELARQAGSCPELVTAEELRRQRRRG